MNGNRLKFILILLSTFFLTNTYADTVTQLNNLHITSDKQQTRLILNLSQTVDYHVFTLANPDRVVIDLPHTRLATSLDRVSLSNTPISRIREGHPTPDVLRLVLDLSKPQVPEAFLLNADNKKNERIVVDLASVNNNIANANLKKAQSWTSTGLTEANNNNVSNVDTKKTNITSPKIDTTSNATSISTTITDSATNNTGKKPVIIVIDPGHGGKDPGTAGPHGVREKDVVLAIGQDLYTLLQKDPNFKVYLTRNSDRFIPLQGRFLMARKDHADMFIAIHADAFNGSDATGASVFALSAHGASSEAARWLAAKENYSELGGVSLSGLSDKSNILRSVLIDLSQTATISSSIQLGNAIIEQLGNIGNLHYHHVEQAPFLVLKNPDIPSLLVETGFLSNPKEEANLNNPDYQQKMAQAIYKGIKNYYWDNPPSGTLIASLANKN